MDTQRKPGWYDGPDTQAGQKRYWDGQGWTDKTTGGGPAPMGSSQIALGILLAFFIIGAVLFGALNALGQFSK